MTLSSRFAFFLAIPILLLPGTIDPVAGQTEAIDALSGGPEEPLENDADGTIALETTPADEDAIAKRLKEIFANLDGLDQVTIEMSAGLVEIGGDVGSKEARDRALDLAARIQGVVDVVDNTTLDRDVERRLLPTVERIVISTQYLIGFLPLLVIAILLVGTF